MMCGFTLESITDNSKRDTEFLEEQCFNMYKNGWHHDIYLNCKAEGKRQRENMGKGIPDFLFEYCLHLQRACTGSTSFKHAAAT
jgi:hypothetical protein